MTVYDINGNAILKPGISSEAVHEEELMKSDFVRLSWCDAERYVIKAGVYVIPYPNTVDLDGNPVKYTLLRDYVPEQVRRGEYTYKPEFQHPKMWLGYVPFLFGTKDAAGDDVKKTEYDYIGSLGTLLQTICDYINDAFGYTTQRLQFTIQPAGDTIDMNETVSVKFDNDDVLSAITKVCDVTGYEYHLSWPQRLFYFGSIYLGGEVGEDTDYELEIGRNIGVPKVTESKEKQYNRFYVQGGSRNNARATEHGNVSLNTRLTLVGYTHPTDPVHGTPAYTYEESIIDTRPSAEQSSPGLTGIITKDDVYPHLELYLYDLHERHKYKTDENGNVTTEPWSIWYFKLAYYDNGWHDFRLKSDPTTAVTESSSSEEEPVVETDLPIQDIGLPVEKKIKDGIEVEQRVATVRKRSNNKQHKVGVNSGRHDNLELVTYFDDEDDDSKDFLNGLEVNDKIDILTPIDLDTLPYQNVTTHAIDGLSPMLGFMYNSTSANANALGTREFEIVFHSTAVTFNAKDDVAGQTGVDAGYYEIIHTTEGSDGLITPSTSDQGIVPYEHPIDRSKNSKAQIFNVVLDDPQGTFKTMAQAELELQAKTEIARIMADQNHYTANANPIIFEESKPGDIKIGRRVAFDDSAGYRINSRIIKLVTRLDYDFETEITIGNTLTKRLSDRIMAQIAKLGSGTGGFDKIDFTPQAQTVNYVEYNEWVSGGSYFFETINKKTGVLETSLVWHRNCLWMCMRTLTSQEPWFTSADWKCVRVTEITLHTTASRRMVMKRTLADSTSVVAVLGFLLMVGNYDASSEITRSQAVWTRQSKGWETDPALAAEDTIWNREHRYGDLELVLRVSDLPSNFSAVKEAQYTITVTNEWVTETAVITI